jgi:hypothetical protein
MVVNTRNWLPGRKVLIAPRWIENICKGRRSESRFCSDWTRRPSRQSGSGPTLDGAVSTRRWSTC